MEVSGIPDTIKGNMEQMNAIFKTVDIDSLPPESKELLETFKKDKANVKKTPAKLKDYTNCLTGK